MSTTVKNSRIHGKGLFSTTKIHKDQVIGHFSGQKSTIPSPYLLWIDENLSIEVEGPFKYINHSNKPNACYYDDFTIVALKNISSDEEITHDYGDDWL